VLDRFTKGANRVVKLIQLDEPQARDEAGTLHATASEIEAFLARHLSMKKTSSARSCCTTK